MKWRKCRTFLIGIAISSGFAVGDDGYGKNHKEPIGKPIYEHRHVEGAVSLILAGITAAEARELAMEHQVRRSKPLPPGIRKNLARGKSLPPGIAKQALPQSMLNDLPHYDGYEWQRQGADLILVSVASGIIADVLFDVFN